MLAGVSLLGTRVDMSESSPWRNWETVLAPDGQGWGLHSFLHPNLSGNQTQLSPSSLGNQMQISPQIITEMSLKRARKQALPTRWPQAGGLQCYSVTLEGTT